MDLVLAFLSPSPMEFMVIAAIALIVLGPARLPDVARSVGKGMREMRDSFQGMADEHLGDGDDDDDEDDDDETPDELLDDDDTDEQALVENDDDEEDEPAVTPAPDVPPAAS
jgi:TatA/E family protein of Tat protein translocase